MQKILAILLLFLAGSRHAKAQYNYELIRQLDTINNDDQFDRIRAEQLQDAYAGDSAALKTHLAPVFESMRIHDSVNLVKVKAILAKYGWLGAAVVGQGGNDALFGVIQHADLKTQQKYLPVMEQAVKKGNARRESLALLQDRVALREGKKQIYGSQVYQNATTKTAFLLPLTDPDHVDERRASVGLLPLAVYLENFNLTWDIQEYKKELPKIEAMLKKNPL